MGAFTHPTRRGSKGTRSSRADQRLENWKLLRAFLWPYFFRSTFRASRVRKPPSRRAGFEVGAELLQGPGQAQDDGARLAVLAAALDVDEDVDPARHLGGVERGADVDPLDLQREVGIDFEVVDQELAGPFADPDAGDGGLAPAGAPDVRLCRRGHKFPARGPSPRGDGGIAVSDEERRKCPEVPTYGRAGRRILSSTLHSGLGPQRVVGLGAAAESGTRRLSTNQPIDSAGRHGFAAPTPLTWRREPD